MIVTILGVEVNLVAQIIDLLAVAILIISYQGGKRKFLLYSSVASVFFCAESLVLYAYPNVVCNVVTIIRNLAIASCDKKKVKFPTYGVVLSLTPIVAIGIYSFAFGDYMSILPSAAAILFTFIALQKNIYLLKIGALVAELCYLLYNFYIGAYVGVIRQSVVITSLIIALINLIKLKKMGDGNEN